MISKKDEAINSILSDFEGFANLVLAQLDLLEKVVSSDEREIPESYSTTILANEKKLDKLEVKISDKIVNTITLTIF